MSAVLSPRYTWTSADPRHPAAPQAPHIGPLDDTTAELVASFEFARNALANCDFSSLDALTYSARMWPRRVPEIQAGPRYHLAYWQGEEAFQLRRAIHRSGRAGRITVQSARQAMDWRLEYLRRQLLKMLGDGPHAAVARPMLDRLALTWGHTRAGGVRWYAFDRHA